MEPNHTPYHALCSTGTPSFTAKLTEAELRLFSEYAEELLTHPKVQEMQRYIQHGEVDCLQHSVAVALLSFWICVRWGLSADLRSVVRGALLHDFFLYDWHEKQERTGLHGLTHPKTALQNARRFFPLNEREENSIARHMWPLTWPPPKYIEGVVICLADKYCSLWETFFCRKQKRS